MLISKFDLCKTEWLDLVFAKRNKEYGAYYLRQHYAGNILKAMGISFFSIISISLIVGHLLGVKSAAPVYTVHTMEIQPYHPPVEPVKAELKKAKPEAAKPQPPITQHKYVQMVVTHDPVIEEPPKLTDLQNAPVGQTEVKVPGSGPAENAPATGKSNGKEGGTGKGDGTEIYSPAGLDVMPEPYGGVEGWSKFLQKNLRYPAQALDNEKTGRVMVSFVIEPDGHLSSLMVDHGAGFGMDEEALRVLKLSKAWKPGFQNGHAVRVKYSLPISFSLNP